MLHLCLRFQMKWGRQVFSWSQSQSNLWPWCYFFWVFDTGTSGLETGLLVKTRFSSIHLLNELNTSVIIQLIDTPHDLSMLNIVYETDICLLMFCATSVTQKYSSAFMHTHLPLSVSINLHPPHIYMYSTCFCVPIMAFFRHFNRLYF
jgi:hypothetical protein